MLMGRNEKLQKRLHLTNLKKDLFALSIYTMGCSFKFDISQIVADSSCCLSSLI